MRLQGGTKFHSMFGAMCLVHCNLKKWLFDIFDINIFKVIENVPLKFM